MHSLWQGTLTPLETEGTDPACSLLGSGSGVVIDITLILHELNSDCFMGHVMYITKCDFKEYILCCRQCNLIIPHNFLMSS